MIVVGLTVRENVSVVIIRHTNLNAKQKKT